MKKLFFLALLGVLCMPLHAQDFRGVTWGMTVDEVKQIEPGKVLDENENMFVYAVTIAGKEAFLFYKHMNDRVIGGGYSFQEKYADKNAYISDYEDLKNQLIGEYGGPNSDEVIWKNNLYREDLDKHGAAVGKGYLVYWADWNAGNTRIELALHGNNDLHVLAMKYNSMLSEEK